MLLTLHSSRECDTRDRPDRRRHAPRARPGPGPSLAGTRATIPDGRGRRCSGCTGWATSTTTAREFLPLAVALASRGVVSLLPAGHFPWVPDPDGTADGRGPRVRDAGRRARGRARPPPGPARPRPRPGRAGRPRLRRDVRRPAGRARRAGDDAGRSRPATRRGRTGSRRTGCTLEDDALKEYAARFSGLDPVDARRAARPTRDVLFQWAGNDTFVTEESRAAYARANPLARSVGSTSAPSTCSTTGPQADLRVVPRGAAGGSRKTETRSSLARHAVHLRRGDDAGDVLRPSGAGRGGGRLHQHDGRRQPDLPARSPTRSTPTPTPGTGSSSTARSSSRRWCCARTCSR